MVHHQHFLTLSHPWLHMTSCPNHPCVCHFINGPDKFKHQHINNVNTPPCPPSQPPTHANDSHIPTWTVATMYPWQHAPAPPWHTMGVLNAAQPVKRPQRWM